MVTDIFGTEVDGGNIYYFNGTTASIVQGYSGWNNGATFNTNTGNCYLNTYEWNETMGDIYRLYKIQGTTVAEITGLPLNNNSAGITYGYGSDEYIFSLYDYSNGKYSSYKIIGTTAIIIPLLSNTTNYTSVTNDWMQKVLYVNGTDGNLYTILNGNLTNVQGVTGAVSQIWITSMYNYGASANITRVMVFTNNYANGYILLGNTATKVNGWSGSLSTYYGNDRNGDIWARSSTGQVYKIYGSNSYVQTTGLPTTSIYTWYLNKYNNQMYIVNYNGQLYKIANGAATFMAGYTSGANSFYSFVPTYVNDDVYIRMGDNKGYKLSGSTAAPITGLSGTYIYNIWSNDMTGDIMLVDNLYNYYILNIFSGIFEKITGLPTATGEYVGMYQNNYAGVYYISTNYGLYVVNLSQGLNATKITGLPDDNYSDLLIDSKGNSYLPNRAEGWYKITGTQVNLISGTANTWNSWYLDAMYIQVGTGGIFKLS